MRLCSSCLAGHLGGRLTSSHSSGSRAGRWCHGRGCRCWQVRHGQAGRRDACKLCQAMCLNALAEPSVGSCS
jgi:hypothetical protein